MAERVVNRRVVGHHRHRYRCNTWPSPATGYPISLGAHLSMVPHDAGARDRKPVPPGETGRQPDRQPGTGAGTGTAGGSGRIAAWFAKRATVSDAIATADAELAQTVNRLKAVNPDVADGLERMLQELKGQ